MSTDTLHGLRVAILVTDGFEQVELVEPARPSMKPGPIPGRLPQAGRSEVGTSPIG